MYGAAWRAGQLLPMLNSYKGCHRSCHCRLLAQLTAAHADILDVISTVRLLLQVRAGICAARLQDMETAMEHFSALLAANPTDFADLYLDVGDLLAETKRFDQVHKASLVPPLQSLAAPCVCAMNWFSRQAKWHVLQECMKA